MLKCREQEHCSAEYVITAANYLSSCFQQQKAQTVYPLVVSVKVLELPLLLLLLSGLMWLFRLSPIELGIPMCKSLRVEAPLPLVLLCWSVVY